jgi:hypothetical protein
MQDGRRVLLLGLAAGFALAACGSASITPPTNNDAGANGACGTYDNPGILKLTGLSPAIGTTVVNQGIVHGFVVENAPAIFDHFTFVYGDAHSAGLPSPSDLKFQTTLSGSNLIYQLTVDAWSHAPGHVELEASNGYATSKGCNWVFPSPLFSYDITPATLDGGAAETNGTIDSGTGSVDGRADASGALDATGALDVPLAFDAPATADAPAEPDAGAPALIPMDTAVDGPRPADAGID